MREKKNKNSETIAYDICSTYVSIIRIERCNKTWLCIHRGQQRLSYVVRRQSELRVAIDGELIRIDHLKGTSDE